MTNSIKDVLFDSSYEEEIVKNIATKLFDRINTAISNADREHIHAMYLKIKEIESAPDNGNILTTPEFLSTLFKDIDEIVDDFQDSDSEFEHFVKEQEVSEIPKPKSLLDQEGGLVSAEEFAKLIGKSNKTVSREFNNKHLIGIQNKEGKTQPRLYPAWQVYNNAVLPAIPKIIECLGDTGAKALRFLLLPAKELNNERPLDYLRLLKDDEVIDLAKERAAQA